jgi:hypothetical protein
MKNESRLTPVERCGKTKDGHIKWRYLCSCGKTTEVAASRVRNGYTKSCGCLVNEAAKLTPKGHGMRNSPTYSSWSSAKDRATNPRSKDFYRYGAVGIGFAKRWMLFECFLEDMGLRPEGTTLDRIDWSKGYEPGNCRWATPMEQARNRKDLTMIQTEQGAVALVDYAKQLGITRGAAHLRMKRGKLEGVINGSI